MGGRRRDTLRIRCVPLAIGTVIIFVLLVAAPATAEPRPSETIHACYSHSDQRELHVMSAQKPCASGQKSLRWDKHTSSKTDGKSTKGNTTYGLSINVENNNTTTNHNLTISAGHTTTDTNDTNDDWQTSVTQSLGDAASMLANGLLVVSLGALALSILLIPFTWLLGLPRRFSWRFPPLRWLGPRLQIQPFGDSGMPSELGSSFAALTQAQIGGQRNPGSHLYLITGNQGAEGAVAAMQGVPQTQALAAAVSMLTLTWSRTRLIVDGSLTPLDDRGTAAVALTLRRNSKVVKTTEIWPSHSTTEVMTPARSNRVLSVAAAGWIEHVVVDQTPGPRAFEAFLSSKPQSWALFRAGSELSQVSRLDEAADYYERALAIDPENIAALVDLAHLRRRDGHLKGAQELAHKANTLIEERAPPSQTEEESGRNLIAPIKSRLCPRSQTAEEPDWYRAQIVLATTHAEWAESEESKAKSDGREITALSTRIKACERSLSTARAAAAERERIERLLDQKQLKRAQQGGKVCWHARLRAWWKAKWAGERFEAARAVELHDLLKTTFEPGALLLVAANCQRYNEPPPEERPFEFLDNVTDDAEHDKLLKEKLKSTRENVLRELDTGFALNPTPLIEYLNVVPRKAPRVLYNLACYYSLALADVPDDNKELRAFCLDVAFDYLRQGISRTPPLERRSLMTRTMHDPDLEDLVEAQRAEVEQLWTLVPESQYYDSASLF